MASTIISVGNPQDSFRDPIYYFTQKQTSANALCDLVKNVFCCCCCCPGKKATYASVKSKDMSEMEMSDVKIMQADLLFKSTTERRVKLKFEREPGEDDRVSAAKEYGMALYEQWSAVNALDRLRSAYFKINPIQGVSTDQVVTSEAMLFSARNTAARALTALGATATSDSETALDEFAKAIDAQLKARLELDDAVTTTVSLEPVFL